MVTRRRQSKSIHQRKILSREELEAEIYDSVLSILGQQDPAVRLPAAKAASSLAAVIASQIAVQTQATQRAFASIEDELSDYAVDFVDHLIGDATKALNGKLTSARTRVRGVERKGTVHLADDWAGPVSGPTDIERFFGIPRSTLYRWQKLNEVVSIETRSSRKPVFPLKQFVDGRPAKGIADAISIVGSPRSAWLWLLGHEFDGKSGLDLLLEGHVAKVLDAAKRHVAAEQSELP